MGTPYSGASSVCASDYFLRSDAELDGRGRIPAAMLRDRVLRSAFDANCCQLLPTNFLNSANCTVPRPWIGAIVATFSFRR
jgi:hypothetical protein